jgi:hypothetical protein
MPFAKKGERIGGRQKGTPNRVHALLKDALLEAATLEGGKGGLVAYLRKQARDNPAPFLALLVKVLPLQINGKVGGTVQMIHSSMSQKEAIELYGGNNGKLD